MEKYYFISYSQIDTKINTIEAAQSIIIVCLILLLAIFFSSKKKNVIRNEMFSIETTEQFRGVAILLLIYDHFTRDCVNGEIITRQAGNWAVIIFLTISGTGLVKRYGLDGAGKDFLLKRIKKIFVPIWITFSLFYLLEYIILGNKYPIFKVIQNYIGIIKPDSPNAPAWFISYILFLYILYYSVSWVALNKKVKITMLFLSLAFVTISINYTLLNKYIGIWKQYTIVFPVAVIVGLYKDKIFCFLRNKFKNLKIYSIGFIAFLCLLYSIQSIFISKLWQLESAFKMELITTINMLLPIYIIIIITIGINLFELANYKFGLLSFLGRYSFEIYLMHYPFMVYYNFFFFRKPLYIFLLIYGCFILGLSYFLNKFAKKINQKIFHSV